ncbi:hypothetical protein C0Q70_02438 [Pomacea canaliculata]|uniref:Uncharacterized protein n=1 Tax=Pomacea canaliculata TaxID=400727 RepID=A0A2T7PPY8_POMCA|nr:hypothetical protein C0Q70_02438 [Pomacea canaliculata]
MFCQTGFRLDFSFHALSALPQQLRTAGGTALCRTGPTSACTSGVTWCPTAWAARTKWTVLTPVTRSHVQRARLSTCKNGKPYPSVIDIDFDGYLRAVKPLSMTREPLCPETHFQCPGSNFYCFPVYVRCNGVFDCPGKQDETACDTYTCPGYYRCRSSHVCLHPDHVCDGWSQCPEGDDELLCDLSCPDTCVCHGLAFTCTARFAASSYLELRYLDASGSGMTPRDVVNNTMIVYLSFNNCSIRIFDDLNFVNLRILDLSNPLSSLHPNDRPPHPVLGQKLNLSDCGVETVAGESSGLTNPGVLYSKLPSPPAIVDKQGAGRTRQAGVTSSAYLQPVAVAA